MFHERRNLSLPHLITIYPCYILIGFLLAFLGCTFLLLVLHSFPPKLASPEVGFTTRGTEISRGALTAQNIKENTASVPESRLKLLDNPTFTIRRYQSANTTLQSLSKGRPRTRVRRQNAWADSNLYFCGHPSEEYAKIVFKASADEPSLTSLSAIKSMCQLAQDRVVSHQDYKTLCEPLGRAYCCPVWSPGNYMALLTGRDSCFSLLQEDILLVQTLLSQCRPFYLNQTLQPDCWRLPSNNKQPSCPDIPLNCSKYNALYDLYHYLSDEKFSTSAKQNENLQLSVTFLPIRKSQDLSKIYLDTFEGNITKYGNISIVAVDFGIEMLMLQIYTRSDTIYPLFACFAVLILTWLYLQSLFLIFAVLLVLLCSVAITLIVYQAFISFLPFILLMSFVVLFCVAIDNVVLFTSTWHNVKRLNGQNLHARNPANPSYSDNRTVRKIVSNTYGQALSILLVSNLTTALSLFCYYPSSISVIKCFAVFAGSLIFNNMCLSVCIIPTALVIHHFYFSYCFQQEMSKFSMMHSDFCLGFIKYFFILKKFLSMKVSLFLCQVMPYLVFKLRFFLFIFFIMSFSATVYLVLFNPGFQLPSNSNFPQFSHSLLFEQYSTKYKYLFRFEQKSKLGSQNMPINIFWGFEPVEGGNGLEPLEMGSLRFDHKFDLSAPSSQQYLLNFCRRNLVDPLLDSNSGLNKFCMIDYLINFMQKPCSYGLNQAPCCISSHFPYDNKTFPLCLKRAILNMDLYPTSEYFPKSGGVIFGSFDESIKGFHLKLETNLPYTLDYTQMDVYYSNMTSWFQSLKKEMPEQLQSGFLTTEAFAFYDVQKSLGRAARGVVLVSSTAVLFCSLLITGQPLLAILTTLTVLAVNLTVFLSLIFAGWKLNLVESIIVALTAGLSVDYTVHMAVAYSLSNPDDYASSEERVKAAFMKVAHTLFMAASTSFVAGLSLLPSSLLAYHKLGMFLCVLVPTSYVYSTVFFPALLSIFNPSLQCVNWSYLCKKLHGSCLQHHHERSASNAISAAEPHFLDTEQSAKLLDGSEPKEYLDKKNKSTFPNGTVVSNHCRSAMDIRCPFVLGMASPQPSRIGTMPLSHSENSICNGGSGSLIIPNGHMRKGIIVKNSMEFQHPTSPKSCLKMRRVNDLPKSADELQNPSQETVSNFDESTHALVQSRNAVAVEAYTNVWIPRKSVQTTL